ncbi:MAG: hypothetical protein H3C41_12190 [Bacteroidales bacterium]|jgi:hypothetical protein|nr:hypothetical protein [Bacteroidales bacterium]
MNETETTVSLAHLAIQSARERFGKTLAFSENSLPDLEDMLNYAISQIDKYKAEKKPTDKMIQRTAEVWGSYLGEVMIHELGGSWLISSQDRLSLLINGVEVDPIKYISKRMTGQESNSVPQFYSAVKEKIDLSRKKSAENAAKQRNVGSPPPQPSKITCGGYIILGIVGLCVMSLLGQCISGFQNLTASPPATADPQEQAAIDAVQNQSTVYASNMKESVAFILVLLENEGHTVSVDGWYVSTGNGYYSVKFYFYLDGKREYAEWWYYADTKFIMPKNDWAFTFMGD